MKRDLGAIVSFENCLLVIEVRGLTSVGNLIGTIALLMPDARPNVVLDPSRFAGATSEVTALKVERVHAGERLNRSC